MSVWFHGVAERRHEIQNPTSAEKIRLLGERLRLGPESVLDVASGRGGPALVLAEAFGCRVVGVERFEGFHTPRPWSGRRRVAWRSWSSSTWPTRRRSRWRRVGATRRSASARASSETLQWQSLEDRLAERPDDPEAGSIRDQHLHWKRRYLEVGRERLGWAILAGWKRPG